MRKSIVSQLNIKKDDIITMDMISFKRPGHGIQPVDLNSVIGKKAIVNISEGTVLLFEMLDGR